MEAREPHSFSTEGLADAPPRSDLEQPAPTEGSKLTAEEQVQQKVEALLAAQRSRLAAQQREKPHLFLRNILNGIFILLAAGAMIGIVIFEQGSSHLTHSYYLGVAAVLVKMVEVMLRMPGWKKNSPPRSSRFNRS